MTHPLQAGATAESLSAENALLARAVTRMAKLLQLIVEIDAKYLPNRAREIARLLEIEREAIEAAARVWPPKGE